MYQRYVVSAASVRIHLAVLLVIGSLFAGSVGVLLATGAVAAPGQTTGSQGRNQNVDYLGPAAAARLDLDFPVLIPSYVPGPFGGEPAVSADGGSYSLYWMNVDATPTFLYVAGEVGGSLPAGSPADLNNELTINANVQGNEAIHDVTATYDAVWWISGGVLYKVESRNMETDSLSLANSLIQFIAPEASEPVLETPAEELPPEAGGGVLEPPTEAPDAPEVPEEPVVTSPVEEGVDEPITTTEPEQAVEDDAFEPEALEPEVVEATEPVAAQSQGEPTTEADPESTVVGQVPPTVAPDPEPTAAGPEGLLEVQEAPEEAPAVDPAGDEPEPAPTAGGAVGSDGTGGAKLPVFGGDGTGGTRDLTVPIPGD